MSTFTKGEQMVPVLNQVGVHCSVYGNHDFGESLWILGKISFGILVFRKDKEFSEETINPMHIIISKIKNIPQISGWRP